jgi:hypothetical protein
VKVDWPMLTNLRLDPLERTGIAGSMAFSDWFKYEFWRFVFVQQAVAKAAQTFIDFPPLQKGASFNMDAVREQVQRAMQAHHGQ